MRMLNLGLKFALEMVAIACFAVWGWQVGSPLVGVVMSIVIPVVVMVIWGLFAAPKATRRLTTRWRVPLELAVFLLAVVALVSASHPLLGGILLLAIVVNAAGLTAFRQWEA